MTRRRTAFTGRRPSGWQARSPRRTWPERTCCTGSGCGVGVDAAMLASTCGRQLQMFQAMGMNGFAQRAQVELRATGERVSRRAGDPDTQLTPQESQIAQLVSDGLANRDIATQLYLSPNAVEYHLQKVSLGS